MISIIEYLSLETVFGTVADPDPVFEMGSDPVFKIWSDPDQI